MPEIPADIEELLDAFTPGRPIIIDLSCREVVGVVVDWESGVAWEFQTDCIACSHPRVEGIWVPLPDMWARIFAGPDCVSGNFCCDSEEVDARLQFTQRGGRPFEWNQNGLVVDRDRWSEAREAWIPVLITDAAKAHSPFFNLIGEYGWLHYPNCD